MSDNLNILIVEDDKDNRKIIVEHIKKYGYDIRFASSKEKALEKIKDNEFDSVIIDVVIPENEDDIADNQKTIGFDLAKEIKKLKDDLDIKFISSFKKESMDLEYGLFNINAKNYFERNDKNYLIHLDKSLLELNNDKNSDLHNKIMEYLAKVGISNEKEGSKSRFTRRDRFTNCIKYLINNKIITSSEYLKINKLKEDYPTKDGYQKKFSEDKKIMKDSKIIILKPHSQSFRLHKEIKTFLNIK